MERFFSNIMQTRGRLAALIELGRPWNGFSAGILSVIGALLALQVVPNLSLLLIAGVVTFIIYIASSILNDVYDVKVDNVNMPYRPLQTVRINIKTAFYFSVIFYAIGIGISLFVSLNFFIVILIMCILSVIYSMPPIEAKNRGFLGNIILGVDTIFMSMLAGYVIITNSLILNFEFLVTISVFTIAFILFGIMKDFKDIHGDKMYGKKTAAVRHGKKLLMSLTTAGTFLLFFASILFNIYFFQSMLFLSISFILFVLLLAVDVIMYKRILTEIGENAWTAGRILILILILNLFAFSFI